MTTSGARRVPALAAVLAWACVACAGTGGGAVQIEQSALVGSWTNEAGARLDLEADRRMTGKELHSAMLGGTTCPDTTAGRWSFFSPPNDAGTSFADGTLTSGDNIALSIDDQQDSCLLSAQVRQDEQGFNLCLVQDPDSGCSAEELLRPNPGR